VFEPGSTLRGAIERTHSLVHQGLDDFLSQKLADLRGDAGHSATIPADRTRDATARG